MIAKAIGAAAVKAVVTMVGLCCTGTGSLWTGIALAHPPCLVVAAAAVPHPPASVHSPACAAQVGITVAGRTLLRPLYKRVAGARPPQCLPAVPSAAGACMAMHMAHRHGWALPCRAHAVNLCLSALRPPPFSAPLSPAETNDTTIFNALTLLVVLGTSLITQLAGLSLALGAFLAGLLLAETEYHLQVPQASRKGRCLAVCAWSVVVMECGGDRPVGKAVALMPGLLCVGCLIGCRWSRTLAPTRACSWASSS